MVGNTNMAGVKFSNMLGQFPDHPNLEAVEKYVIALKEHRYDPEQYFDKKADKEMYNIVKDFFTGNNGTFEYAAVRLYSLASQYYRALNGVPVGLKEKSFANKFKKDYLRGGKAMKAVAWIAVHAYICNSFIARSGIENMIPINHPELAPLWNEYIMMMDDVPNEIRKLFVMDSDSHCEFINGIPAKVTKEDMTALCDDEKKSEKKTSKKKVNPLSIFSKLTVKKDKDKSDNPSDDDTFDQSAIMDDPDIIDINSRAEVIAPDNKEDFDTKGAIDGEVKDVKESDSVDQSQEKSDYVMNMAEKEAEAVEAEKAKEEVPEKDLGATDYIQEQEEEQSANDAGKEFTPNVDPINEYTFGQLKDSVTFTDGKLTAAGEAPEPLTEQETQYSKENFKNELIGKVPEYHVGENAEEDTNVNNYYSVNNTGWHNIIPGLNGFTRIIHKAGYLVQYLEAQNYPGLILAQIIDMNMNNGMGGIRKIVFIDPGWIYGDTIRMISAERHDNDITKEIYLSQAQEKYIIKMLQTGLDKEDRQAINKELPRSIYYVINHVDLSGIKGNMKNFFQWRSLITNVSNVLRSMPECRFRICEVKSQHEFKLICDDMVRCAFHNKVYELESHKKAAENGLWVSYDKSKTKSNNGKTYIVGSMTNVELWFDPYKNYDNAFKATKKEKKVNG